MGFDRAQRKTHLAGNFFVRKILKKSQCQQLPGQGGQILQRGMQTVLSLNGQQQILRIIIHSWLLGKRFFGECFGRIPAAQGVECAAAGNGQHPRLDAATGRVETWRLPPDLPESVLGDLLGRLRLAGDAQSQAMDATGQYLVELGQSLFILTNDTRQAGL